jgi:outer membrane protein assembly factor BamA
MFAKQTAMSAAIIALLGGSSVADPGGDGRGYFQLGAGYNTDDGFIVNAAVDQPSLFHSGIELGELATISERYQLFDAKLDVPSLARFDIYSNTRKLPGFERSAAGLSMRHTMQVSEHVSAFIGYRIEDVSIERDAAMRSTGVVPDSAGLVSALTAGFTYRDKRTAFGAWADHADPRLGSDLAFSKVGGFVATNQPIGPFTIHASGSYTRVFDAPLSERLFLDGSTDVCGFAPGAFGPVGGATQKLVGHTSLELALSQSFSLEGFLDYARLSNMDFTSPIGIAHAAGWSAGYGLIWHSPIGPLHLDLAYPGGGPATWFISFGAL